PRAASSFPTRRSSDLRVSLRVKINSAGAEALLKDPKVLADLRRRARAIAKAAGGSSVGEVGEERSRAAAIGDPDKLVRALDEGRDRKSTRLNSSHVKI